MKPSEALRELVENLDDMIAHEIEMSDWMGERHFWTEAADRGKTASAYRLARHVAAKHLAAAEARESAIDPYGPMPGSEDEGNFSPQEPPQ